MPVTKEQAQILTILAIACRPHRAPTWDEAGVMATLAKCRDWSLAEVALRVIVAASDREARTPAVILSPGMVIPAPKADRFKPQTWDPAGVCTTCSKPEPQCRAVRFADDDHPFISRAANARDTERPPEAIHAIVTDLRGVKATEEPPVRVKRPVTTEGTEHVAPIRAALHEEATA